MNTLFERIKRRTFIFTDEQINNKIQQLNDKHSNCMDLFIIRHLYEDKQILTKDEYRTEIIEYLYANSINSKTKIDEVLINNKDWFYDQYNLALNKEPIDYYYAVQHCRHELMNFLQPKHNPLDKDDNEDDDLLDDE